MEMVRTNRTTVIITTHYIEEARQAHAVSVRVETPSRPVPVNGAGFALP